MITGIICFFIGSIFGVIATSLAVVAEDAERCDECAERQQIECKYCRSRLYEIWEERERERSNSETDK